MSTLYQLFVWKLTIHDCLVLQYQTQEEHIWTFLAEEVRFISQIFLWYKLMIGDLPLQSNLGLTALHSLDFHSHLSSFGDAIILLKNVFLPEGWNDLYDCETWCQWRDRNTIWVVLLEHFGDRSFLRGKYYLTMGKNLL